MLSKELMDLLQENFDFSTISQILQGAKKHLGEEDIVPTIVPVGRTGAGKSSLINALLGRPVAEVGVIPTTQEPTPYELSAEGIPLRVVDLPGIGESGKHGQRMETLLGILDKAHILLLTLPCPERNLDYEVRLLEELQQPFAGCLPLPLLVAGTKIDCAPPARQWDAQALNLAQPSTEKELNIREWLTYAGEVVFSARPRPSVHPRDSRTSEQRVLPCASGACYDDEDNQYGIAEIRRSIYEALPEAARTFFARVTQDRALIDKRAQKIALIYSSLSSAAAAQPVPTIPDAALIMPLQVAMLMKLTRLHGQELTQDLAMHMLGPFIARMAGRLAFEQVVKWIPGVGSVAGGAVAGGMTYALGMGYHTLLKDGNWNFDGEALKEAVLEWWGKGVSR